MAKATAAAEFALFGKQGGADHLARAWFHTYGLPVLVSNSSNNYGPYPSPELRRLAAMFAGNAYGRHLQGLSQRAAEATVIRLPATR